MVELRHLEKYYARGGQGEVHAVRDTSLILPETGIVALFGKSGCGKTTLLNLVGGLDMADGGEVLLDGAPVTPTANEARNRHIGYIFQNYHLLENETVFENVALSLRLCGVTDKKEIETRTMAALEAVDMASYRRRLPGTLSGGQQQRVAIARALVKKPRLILADEPTGNLDEQNTLMVMELLRQVAKDHLVLLVTHEEELLPYFCDRIIEISDGSVISVRENTVADGYTGQSKTEVYLGDLPREEGQVGGTAIAYYGAPGAAPASLRLISHGGVLYLSADPGVRMRVLDSSAEIRVHEGSYHQMERKPTKTLDPVLLTEPCRGQKRWGKMFGWLGATVSGFRTHFGKIKKGRSLLIIGLFLFALVFVVMVSSFGTAIGTLREARYTYNTDTVYIAMSSLTEEALATLQTSDLADTILPEALESYGGYQTPWDTYRDTWYFSAGNFESVSETYISFSGTATALDVAAIKGKKVLVEAPIGKYTELSDYEVVISSGFADILLQNCGISGIRGYQDLLHLTCTNGYSYGATYPYRTYSVVGIVEDPNSLIYMNTPQLTTLFLRMFGYRMQVTVGYLDEETLRVLGLEEPAPGVVYRGTSGVYGASSDSVKILGKAFSVDDTLYTLAQSGTGDALTLSGLVFDYYMSREEYAALLWRTEELPVGTYEVSATHYAVHSGNIQALLTLCETLGCTEGMVTSDDLYAAARLASSSGLISTLISATVFVALMVLCLIFIMRSGILASTRQLGILRAIGVSRSNLLFRYFVESLVVFFLTVFPGYLVGSGILWWLTSRTTLLQSVFYYPVWLGGITFLFLLGVTVFCGILPILLLLRKTPAQILAKYDI